MQTLKQEADTNETFRGLLYDGLKGREQSEANMNFLIEEIVVTHLIREQMIPFPKTLVNKDHFRLVVYPGPAFEADRYQTAHKLLTTNQQCTNPYRAAHYDAAGKVLDMFVPKGE